ncbi:MAG: RNA polymerase sigma factor [Anaerolineae bacterium]
MVEQDDRVLIALAREDPNAFGALYERYVNRIFNYVFHRVGNVHDAEDLTSRAFFSAFSHLDSYQEQGVPFSAWLYRIAHNLIANWHRDRSRRPVVSLEDITVGSPVGEHPEPLAEQEETARQLAAAIQTLEPARRELLVLKITEGLSNLEIGKILGKSEGAIKSLYHRTLLTLRKELEKKGLEL